MGIESRHAYRFGFLKSEEWQNIRLECLIAKGIACHICGFEDFHNDVHHVMYPRRWKDTTPDYVVVLCRDCHELVHESKFKRISDRWREIRRLRWLKHSDFEEDRKQALYIHSLRFVGKGKEAKRQTSLGIDAFQLPLPEDPPIPNPVPSKTRKSGRPTGRCCFRCGGKFKTFKFNIFWRFPVLDYQIHDVCGFCAMETTEYGSLKSNGVAWKCIKAGWRINGRFLIDFPNHT